MRSISTLGARRHLGVILPRHAVGWRTGAIILVLVCAFLPGSLRAQTPPVERLSNRSNGQSGEGGSQAPSLSADARFAVFGSDAIDLVSLDRNQRRDVFLSDRREDTIFRVSVAQGAEANGNSEPGGFSPSISDDGCVVAFSSRASNLVDNDTNEREDVFVLDCRDQVIRRVSVGIGAEANGASTYTDLSADGRFVVFQSAASNLIENDGNATVDIFVFDRESGETTRASVGLDGAEANGFSVQPSLSGDGRFVTFASEATNLVEGDTNAVRDIFVFDRESGETTRASVSSSGLQADGISFFPVLDFDGSIVAFKSEATNLEGAGGDTNGFPDVFVRDRGTGVTTRVSEDSFGNEARDGLSSGPSLSADGRFVAFASGARNLVAEDGNLVMDVFVVDRSVSPHPEIRVTALADKDDTGGAPDVPVHMSANGRWIGFTSAAVLLPLDVNNDFDAYVACNPFDPTLCASQDVPTPTPTPTNTPDGFCNGNEDCEPPQVCVDHMCVDPTPTPTPPGFCNSNDDCEPPQVCVDHMCVDPTPTPTPPGFCTNNDDCPPPQVCVDMMCVDPSPTPTPPGFCMNNDDCPPPQVCVDMMCVNPTPTRTPIGFCTGNDDCPPPQVCVDMMCVNPTPTRTPIGFCTGNDDCPPPQVCVDMMCSEPSPTPIDGRGGGGGGGCSCKVDPREPRPGSLDAWAMALPALILVLRRRVRRGSSV